MSYKRADGIFVIEPEPESICELCGAVAETRPYGPKGENICVPCGMKDPESTSRRIRERIFGKEVVQ